MKDSIIKLFEIIFTHPKAVMVWIGIFSSSLIGVAGYQGYKYYSEPVETPPEPIAEVISADPSLPPASEVMLANEPPTHDYAAKDHTHPEIERYHH